MSVNFTDLNEIQEDPQPITASGMMSRLQEAGIAMVDNSVTASRMPPPPKTAGLFPAGQYDVRGGYYETPVMNLFVQSLPQPMPAISYEFNRSSNPSAKPAEPVLTPRNTMGMA